MEFYRVKSKLLYRLKLIKFAQKKFSVCFTYWGLQAELLVTQLNSGTGENRNLYSEISKDLASSNLKFILYYSSIKYEIDIPASKYDSYVEFHLRKNNAAYTSQLRDYIKYHLLPFNENPLYDYEFILVQDYSLSVIDSYLELKKIIALIVSNKIADPTLTEYFSSRIPGTSGIFNDSYWDKLNSYFSGNQYPNLLKPQIFLESIALLANNKNIECIALITAELKRKPNSYNLYQIFVEAINLAGGEIGTYIDEGSFLHFVLTSMHQVIRKEQNHNENLEDIEKLAYLFDICDFHIPLISMLHSENYPNVPFKSRTYLYLINQTYSINDVLYYAKDLEIQAYSDVGLFIGVKMQIDYFLQNSEFVKALKLLNRNDFQTKCLGSLYYETWLTRKKLYCLTKLKDLSSAADVVVRYYFKNNRVFDSLFYDTLIDEIVELDGTAIYKNINIPILFSIYNLSSSVIYDSIANYLIQNSVAKASEVIAMSSNTDEELLCYFLEKVCVINNIQDSPYLDSIEKVEKERIIVLSQLKKLRIELSTEINNEIFDITQKATVRDCLQNIYDSRIYVETNGVKKLLVDGLSDYFERYLTIQDFTFQDLSLFVVNKGKEDESYSEIPTYITYFNPPLSQNEYELISILFTTGLTFTHPNGVDVPYSRYLAFADIFENIKHQFLFNEDFGLKFFLSMRIRHGTLPNFLKNVFERSSLIINEGIQKETILNHWVEKIAEIYQPYKSDNFIDLLEKFTVEIESLTAEGVSWVKIKEAEEDVQSMFIYEFSQNDFFYYFRNRLGYIKEIGQFIDEVFEILWIRTNEILVKLKEKFTNVLLIDYLSQIDKLHRDVDLLFGENNFFYFKDLLVTTKTDIQNAIQKSTNWFNISKSKSIGEIPILAILQTSTEYLNILNSNAFKTRIDFDESISFSHNIKGEYFILFCDIFNTILGNVIEHTKRLTSAKCQVSIIENDSDEIIIKVSNSYDGTYTVEQTETWNLTLKESKGNYDASFEGNSGFLKLKKMLNSDPVFRNYRVSVSSDSDTFTLCLTFNLKNLIV